MDKPIVIGIAGGTGSGKTTLVDRLRSELGDNVVAMKHDDYYKANSQLTLEERKKLNYDHPYAFDTNMLIDGLKQLIEGKSIEVPTYDFVQHTRSVESKVAESRKVIILEGILIFENKDLRELLDIKVFVDTDADVRFIRRLLRDVKKRGRDLDSVVNQYLGTVKLMHEEFVEPSKRYADIIIPEGGKNEVAVSMLLDRIRNLLK